jgi:uncharacterized protein YndB with AHSA1/START domain
MNEFEGSATFDMAAAPADVFAVITDAQRLPEWNRCIAALIDAPPSLDVGSQWIVQMHVPRFGRWKSISTVDDLQPETLNFSYRSKRVDNNPTDALWHWQLTPIDAGTRVDVSWEGHPRTFVRKMLAAPVRSRQLPNEVDASLHSLAELVARGVVSS